MTIRQAIALIDSLMPNQIDSVQKVYWLSTLDGQITNEIHKAHEGIKDDPYTGYSEETPQDTVLLVPEPYDELYRWYLEMQIFDANGEIVKYNNASVKYNSALASYMNYVNRTFMPVEKTKLILW